MPGPKCKLCISKNRLEYERLYKDEHKTFIELEEIAKSKFAEEISNDTFQRHMTKHFSAIVHKFSQVDVSAKKTIDEEVVKTRETLKEIQENVKMLKDWIGSFKDMDKTPEAVNALTKLLAEYRETLMLNEKFIDKLASRGSGMSEAELLREMVYASEGLCDECKEVMVTKLEQRVKQINESSQTSD